MSIINTIHYNLSSRQEEFFSAAPIPHIILDDFLDPDYFEKLATVLSYNESISIEGKEFNSEVERGKWISLNSSLPSHVKAIIDEMNSEEWVSNLRQLTGIDSLHPTKVGNTKLANYHEMKPGGVLGSHVDHATDPDSGLPHVLNNLIYLSDNWSPSFGGGTEFFDKSGNKKLGKVEYKRNRSIIFLHTPYSFHGVEQISSQAFSTRKSIYVDYYCTNYNPYAHMKLPFKNHWFYHPTTFPLNSLFDYFIPRNLNYFKSAILYRLNKMKADLSS
jgi:hypothetical protein